VGKGKNSRDMEGKRTEARQGKTVLPIISFSWRDFKPERKKLPPISHHLSNSRSRYFFHKSSSTRTIVPAMIPLRSPSHSPVPSPVKFAYIRTQLALHQSGRHHDHNQSPHHEEANLLALSSTLQMSHLEVRRTEERGWRLRGAQSRSVQASPWA
jgi:hypothetical protein